jgi:hypothetical protein
MPARSAPAGGSDARPEQDGRQAARGAISTMRSASSAVVMRSSKGIVGMTPPASRRDKAGWVMAARRASSVWDRPSACRRSRIARPMRNALGLGVALPVSVGGAAGAGEVFVGIVAGGHGCTSRSNASCAGPCSASHSFWAQKPRQRGRRPPKCSHLASRPARPRPCRGERHRQADQPPGDQKPLTAAHAALVTVACPSSHPLRSSQRTLNGHQRRGTFPTRQTSPPETARRCSRSPQWPGIATRTHPITQAESSTTKCQPATGTTLKPVNYQVQKTSITLAATRNRRRIHEPQKPDASGRSASVRTAALPTRTATLPATALPAPGPVLPAAAVPGPAIPGPAIPGPAVPATALPPAQDLAQKDNHRLNRRLHYPAHYRRH